jgi:hypothetical protein
MRYERVKVTRDTNTVHSREVAPWEIPMLEHLFGDDGNVVRTGEFVVPTEGKLINKGAYPDGKTELNRLIDAYKSDPKSGIPYAISVYGNAAAGARALQKLIDDAKSEDEAADLASAPAPAKTKKRGRAAEADSLLS